MSYALSMPTPAPAPSNDPSSSGARLVATGGRALPLRSAHLEAEAGAGLCRTILTQRFVNPHAEPLHVTYLLPLPSDGAVSGFSFTLGEVRVVGEVDTRAQARERFEQAMATGRTAALVEQDRSSLFTQEVGNVPPGEEIVCEIVIDQPLRWLDEGAWEWRFPTVVGPRYMGSPGTVADAAKVTVGVASHGTGAKSSLALAIGDALSGPIESTSHRVQGTEADERTEVRFGGGRLDRDVVVRWPVAGAEPGATLRCARPASERHDGASYGLLTVVPPKAAAMAHARDLILLLDTSGSMSGRPLDQLKRVSLALLESLTSDDRLELISFGSRPERFRPEPIRATRDGKAAARKWLSGLRASGGTEMHTAVLEALRPLRGDAQRQVVLMTDGFIGFEDRIVTALLERLPVGARLHTVGVGSAPNRSLTEAAARAGRGTELIVGLEEDAERAVHRLLARTAAPLVTELTVEGAQLIAPRQLPDLYAGCPAMISLALAPGAEAVEIRGRGVDGPFEARIAIPDLELGEGDHGVVARFGRERIEDLEMELTATSDSARLDAAIERVGLRFQIASRLTSWIAVTEEVTVKAPARHEEMPHELPEGVSAEGLGLRPVGVTDADRKAIDDLEQRRGEPYPADKRARLEQAAARQRVDPPPMTRSGFLKGDELDQEIREVVFGRGGGGAAQAEGGDASILGDLDDDALDEEVTGEGIALAEEAPEAERSSSVLFHANELAAVDGYAADEPVETSALIPGEELAEPAPQPAMKGRARVVTRGAKRRAKATRPPASAPAGPPPAEPLASAPSQRSPAEVAPERVRLAKSRPNPLLVALIVLLVALIIGGLAWWLTTSTEEPPAAPAETSEVAPGG